MFIYLAVCRATGLPYVGQTWTGSVEQRWAQHVSEAKLGSMKRLHRAIREYRSESFTVTVIDTAETRDELNRKERAYIRLFHSLERGYNTTAGGSGTLPTSGETR